MGVDRLSHPDQIFSGKFFEHDPFEGLSPWGDAGGAMIEGVSTDAARSAAAAYATGLFKENDLCTGCSKSPRRRNPTDTCANDADSQETSPMGIFSRQDILSLYLEEPAVYLTSPRVRTLVRRVRTRQCLAGTCFTLLSAFPQFFLFRVPSGAFR